MDFSENITQKVWEKGIIVLNNNPNIWRKDQCGAWIGRTYYGNRDSQYGWEIDHIKPDSKGGEESLFNLRPLQWKNNADKQDGNLVCSVVALGINNKSR